MRSPQEHIEQAERFADAVLVILSEVVKAPGAMIENNIRLSDMMLHGADVELSLAHARRAIPADE